MGVGWWRVSAGAPSTTTALPRCRTKVHVVRDRHIRPSVDGKRECRAGRGGEAPAQCAHARHAVLAHRQRDAPHRLHRIVRPEQAAGSWARHVSAPAVAVESETHISNGGLWEKSADALTHAATVIRGSEPKGRGSAAESEARPSKATAPPLEPSATARTPTALAADPCTLSRAVVGAANVPSAAKKRMESEERPEAASSNS